MEDSPHQRAIRRSAWLNAASHQPLDAPAKLPLGREPSKGPTDWAHRCHVLSAWLVPGGANPRLHALGLPRPRTTDGWPIPFAGKDPDDPCADVLDGVMLDTRDYVGFIAPVWHRESTRDAPGPSDAVHRQLEAAAAVNAQSSRDPVSRLAGRRRR